MNAGGAILARLKALGVDYIFANSGTDFPPIIEGLAEAQARQIPLPTAIVVPHESAAMAMAHGYALVTGRAQAVMAHTNVGLANCAIGAINAAVSHVPVILFSGRTPTVERGRLGARTVPIGWGQEMRDQAALVREASKWDYELRFPEQALEMVDRAYAIAHSTPPGPVYLSLPREVLCADCPADGLQAPPLMAASVVAPTAEVIAKAAAMLAGARNPVIVAQRGAGSPAAFDALAEMVGEWGIPVVRYWAVQLALATDHDMDAGDDPAPWVTEADVILVIDSMAPWSPEQHALRPECRVIQLGPDPLYARVPVRNFAADLCLPGETGPTLLALAAALLGHASGTEAVREERRRLVASANRARREGAGAGSAMSKEWVGRCLSAALEGRPSTVLSELGVPLGPLVRRDHGSWFQEPHSGGLGWSFPCALGMKLAEPGRLVVATMGDGSYIFSNPVACHQVAEALGLSLLVVVLNNAGWGAVRRSVLDVYPEGQAAKSNAMPLVSLDPVPDFTHVAAASRAFAERVSDAAALPAAIARALEHVTEGRGLALLDVIL